ncbi:hypothetical protein [Polaribacter vadi]|uniref:hypothetical protein n=1 Tax=Polaribacter vadi TaxID=1774273 RepID=UPI0030EB4AD1|tara:strand:+ start:7963 stop:8193 length:231 start_codon:yes stop_codon:yes gene_type:complete
MNHEHAICNSKTVKHIHEKDVDCELHLLKQSTSFLAENNFEILINTIITKNNSIAYNYLKNHTQLSFSLRGPPQSI